MNSDQTESLARTLNFAFGGGASALVAVATARWVRVRVRRPRLADRPPRWLGTLVSSLGLALLVAVPATAAGSRRPDRPIRGGGAVAPPWSTAEGNPPPRPSVGIRVIPPPQPDARLEAAPSDEAPARAGTSPNLTPDSRMLRGDVHPAVHGHRAVPSARLFPRVDGHPVDTTSVPSRRNSGSSPLLSAEPCEDKRACMERHPAGGNLRSAPRTYTVQSGDTLWDIAERVIGRADLRAIARYWPQIHRANRELIGSNPDVIHPGMVLRLPPRP